VTTWRIARQYSVKSTVCSEIALSRQPFGIRHMYIYTFLLRITNIMTSQNIDLSCWDPQSIINLRCAVETRLRTLRLVGSECNSKATDVVEYLLKYLITQSCRARARGSVVGWATMTQAGRSRIRFPMRSLDISIDLILPAALWPWDRLSL
jgi:hypothetical protein